MSSSISNALAVPRKTLMEILNFVTIRRRNGHYPSAYPEISKESAMKMGRKYIPQKVSIKDIEGFAANCQTEFELWRSIAIRQSQKLPDVLAAVIQEFPNQIGASILNCCEQNCNYLLHLLK